MKVGQSSAVAASVAALFASFGAQAEGNLASDATRLPDMMIDSVELRLSQSQFEVETGRYYRWRIVHDGAEEMAVVAPELFRNSWIDQVIVDDLEITPLGLYSVEFDEAGTIDIWLVPIRPGRYEFWVPGYEERGLAGSFLVN